MRYGSYKLQNLRRGYLAKRFGSIAVGDNIIFLRVFAAASDQLAADAISVAIEEKLRRHGRTTGRVPKRYWKIPEYFEIFVELQPVDKVSETFSRILHDLGLGWEVHNLGGTGSWAVWNEGENSTFMIDEVRWANLECLQKSNLK